MREINNITILLDKDSNQIKLQWLIKFEHQGSTYTIVGRLIKDWLLLSINEIMSHQDFIEETQLSIERYIYTLNNPLTI